MPATTVHDILAQFRHYATDERGKGDAFERLMAAYLRLVPQGAVAMLAPHLWWVRHQGAILLKAWMENAMDGGLLPMVKVAYSVTNHWDGVLRWFES